MPWTSRTEGWCSAVSLDEQLAKAFAIPPGLVAQTRRVWYEGSEEEFWEFFDWIADLPDPPTAATAEEYIRLTDPFYWGEDELSEVL